MKTLTNVFSVIALTTASFATFAATEVNSAPAGEYSAGTISTSVDSGNVDALNAKLAAKATQDGARSYRIITSVGENNLSGSAEIYK
ncbi:DUF1471 domain-containing protein [Rouxiella badensis]|jgi:multiple stress resistance protein BhsA|uniref:multiple stress resistance protein BhsA n=1 Tax=Rouxiella badensis TaxID=1646377 RepID=UPI000382994B|nr:YdgH/BhsA/McbA-like domain containing protein [Rouxiella badensis]MCC3745282.1 DUF1471 domain-containing protein [Rouxiella badensis]QOI53738.1 DUF1471 domain-containing protein [Rouxiella badensis subsp. acadiensis]